ncbi:MAG: cation diffusion facilitator family transporter [Halobacteriales archaeon]|nr:cation diffusion facilitator family transporter [Halobacteriales archaeon]
MASTKRVVIAALIANFLIAVAKFIAWSITGSSSMLSEAYHSVSDTGNQVLLLLGMRLGSNGASRKHPFGRGKEQFFFAFVVSVMLFGVAGYASLRHGYHKFGAEHADANFTINYVVLSAAFVFEAWALKNAYEGVRREMKEKGFGNIVEAFRKSKDAPLITALTEDAVALAGIVVAFASVGLTDLTGNNVYDAIGSVLIGLLLMGFALALAWENRSLIVGEGVTKSERTGLIEAVEGTEGVVSLIDLRTLHMGPDSVLVTVEAEFEGGMTTSEVKESIERVENAVRETLSEADQVYVEARKPQEPTRS